MKCNLSNNDISTSKIILRIVYHAAIIKPEFYKTLESTSSIDNFTQYHFKILQ